MAFSNVFDNTFPPDTQLANLLGQDIRNFKLDIQQRMAAISGLDASKPAFGSDSQPAAWNGILFFATDTGKIYQWNNPAWTLITTLQTGAKQTNLTQPVLISGTNTVMTIPSGTMVAGSHVRIGMGFIVNGVGGSMNFFVAFGGHIVSTNLQIAANRGGGVQIDVMLLNLTTAVFNSQGYDTPTISTTFEASPSSIPFAIPSVATNNTNIDIVVSTNTATSLTVGVCVAEVF